MMLLNEKTFPNEERWEDLDGFLLVRESVPAYTPKNIFQQIVVVSGGGSTSLYIYDVGSLAWKSVALT